MKNNMKRIIKLSIFIILSLFFIPKQIISDEFNFEGEEIQILNKNLLYILILLLLNIVLMFVMNHTKISKILI